MIESFNYIVIKDPHFMFGFRNNIRKHGWERHIDAKLEQIQNYALEHGIVNIFFTGDVFEKSKKKDWSFNQMQQNKERLQKFKKLGLNVYSNMGNHDYFDGHEGHDGTVFGEMVDLDLITHIGSDMRPINFKVGPDEKIVSLFGIDYHQSTDRVLDEMQRISSYIGCDVKIALIHSNVTDKNVRLTDFTYEQLSQYNLDIINCGHWHLQPEGGGIQKVGNTHFLNPWNLTRVMRDYHVKLDEHIPSFIHANIVFVGDEPKFEFKEIPLNVQVFSEAFNIDVINLLQELGKEGFTFFEDIQLDQEEDMNDDELLLDTISETHKVSEDSIKIAKELLT